MGYETKKGFRLEAFFQNVPRFTRQPGVCGAYG
jgi:hypothetical protein